MQRYYLSDCQDRLTQNPKHYDLMLKPVSILECEIGKSAWLCFKFDEEPKEWDKWHSIRTSKVQNVIESSDGTIIITTLNTVYTLSLIKKLGDNNEVQDCS